MVCLLSYIKLYTYQIAELYTIIYVLLIYLCMRYYIRIADIRTYSNYMRMYSNYIRIADVRMYACMMRYLLHVYQQCDDVFAKFLYIIFYI